MDAEKFDRARADARQSLADQEAHDSQVRKEAFDRLEEAKRDYSRVFDNEGYELHLDLSTEGNWPILKINYQSSVRYSEWGPDTLGEGSNVLSVSIRDGIPIHISSLPSVNSLKLGSDNFPDDLAHLFGSFIELNAENAKKNFAEVERVKARSNGQSQKVRQSNGSSLPRLNLSALADYAGLAVAVAVFAYFIFG